MQKRAIISSAALVVLQMLARGLGAVPVEQIEAYDTPAGPWNGQPYAPVNFNGAATVTINGGGDGGQYNGITFHADLNSGDGGTVSGHAQTVGDFFYGSAQSPAYPYVTDVYDISADEFLYVDILPQGRPTVGPLPVAFAGGAEVINNSYVTSASSTNSYLDTNRRLDFMINQADVVWVAAAVTGGASFGNSQYQIWSNFNGLAVSGVQNSQQSFNPAGSPGKQHADLSIPTEDASFATATVSGYAAALWGNAEEFNQVDAQHGYLIRSLLMTGADHNTYTRPGNTSSGALDPINGAGQPDYAKSLTILEGGESQLLDAGTIGPIASNQQGWAIGTVPAGGQSVVLFQSSNITGLTATLNWNVTSPMVGTTQINTSTGALLFPNLALNICPVTFNTSTGQYSLGTAESDPTLQSAVPGDNVQYLSSTASLPAGTYAFVITGDPSIPATVGLSYMFAGSFASQFNASGGGSWGDVNNWGSGVPNGQAEQAILAGSPGSNSPSTITLDGNHTIGQLTFNNSAGYILATGTGGVLTIDDTTDSTGTPNPMITVLAGSHVISAAVSLVGGVNVTVAAGSALNVSGGITGTGGLTKAGAGVLEISANASYGATTINGGTFTLDSGVSLSSSTITINAGTLNFAASTGSGILIRTYPIAINSSGGVTLAAAPVATSRQLLVSNHLSIAGSAGNWTGQLDLANNDLDIPGGNLADVTSQLQQGSNIANGGGWNGAGGIISSYAPTDTTNLMTLGVIKNNQTGAAHFTSSNPFDGITPGASDILVKYTYYGDATLDGTVTSADYTPIDLAWSADQTDPTAYTGWYYGDFNYDGVINGSDYTLIDNTLATLASLGGKPGAAIASEQAALTSEIAGEIDGGLIPVPEPATFGVLFMGAISLSRRRHK